MSTNTTETNAPTVATPTVLRAEIDTDLNPKFNGDYFSQPVGVETHIKSGKMLIERKGDELWLGGKKVILCHFSLQDDGEWTSVDEHRVEIASKSLLNGCVLDFLHEHTDFIPESWKKDEDHIFLIILFLGTVYYHADGKLYAHGFYRINGAWLRCINQMDQASLKSLRIPLLEEPVS